MFANLFSKILGRFFIECQFALVVEAKHPLATVRDVLAVVLLMASTVVFNQAFFGYRTAGSTK